MFIFSRREFLHSAVASTAALALTDRPVSVAAQAQSDAIIAKIAAQHDATLKMLRDWIALPSIAAENLNDPQGAEYMARLARDAGFQHVEIVPRRSVVRKRRAGNPVVTA